GSVAEAAVAGGPRIGRADHHRRVQLTVVVARRIGARDYPPARSGEGRSGQRKHRGAGNDQRSEQSSVHVIHGFLNTRRTNRALLPGTVAEGAATRTSPGSLAIPSVLPGGHL